MRVLGIETSCDETGVAICEGGGRALSAPNILANVLHSQVNLHAAYGGVVPELASRDHVCRVLPLIEAALSDAKLSRSDIDGIAYTRGPGLIGALMVGASIARSLAFALDIPSVDVHHMEGHLLAVMLEDQRPNFPFLALLVSGGHTLLVKVDKPGCYELLGQSLDDAAGEAFDKVAKWLGLSYPGGPAIAQLALKGSRDRFRFPRPMLDRPGLDFSFSGLKTAVINQWHQFEVAQQTESLKADIAASFEQAVVDTLVAKSVRALEQTGLKCLVVAGGVGANQRLRESFNIRLNQKTGFEVFYPRPKFCTDNGAMIAYVGCLTLSQAHNTKQWYDRQENLAIRVSPRWSLDEL